MSSFRSRGKGWRLLAVAAIIATGATTVTLLTRDSPAGSASPASSHSPKAATPSRAPQAGAERSATQRQANGDVAGTGRTATREKTSLADRPTPRSSPPFPTAFDVAARVGSACVRPGERQTITITTRPDIAVAYHATYSDGKDAFDQGYYGGNNGGATDGKGSWTDSWVVGSAAPPGQVRVDVVGQAKDGRGYTVVFFDVADAAGKCGS